MVELTERRFEELSEIAYTVYTCPFQRPSPTEVLVVHFSGTYGIGSGGNNDASFMTAIVKAALAAWRSRALVIDLSNLAYEWGDAISQVLDAGVNRYNKPFPTAIVVSEANRVAIIGLLRFISEEPDNRVFNSLENAVAYLEHICLNSNN